MKFVSAGLAASIAEAVTIPIDTAKVRLQVLVYLKTNNASFLASLSTSVVFLNVILLL